MDTKKDIFYDINHNTIKLEITTRRKTEKFTRMWRLNNTLLNSQWIKEKITNGVRKYLETHENEDKMY